MINKLKSNKKDLICIGILLLIYLVIILIITRFKFAYGSSMDWDNQHYAFPEYFRNLFYDTKNFFPSFAPHIGAGQSIYNFSYYGLFNPLILFSYLLPFVSMSSYVQILSIVSVIVSVIMFYFWLRRRYDIKVAFFISCMFLMAAPIIFHSHRHIMFVSYLPFFIGALFCCDKFFENKNRSGLIFCMAMIMFISYYFSIGSYLAVFVYITAIYLNKNAKFKIKEYLKSVLNLVICMAVSVMISAILWMPTIYAILSGRANTNVKISLKDILLPTLDYKAVMYSPYSMGLTAIALMSIVFAVIRKSRGKRFIGVVLSLFAVFKLLIFIMNGFMYGDEKALIPFIPLALLLTAEFVKEIFQRNVSTRFWMILNTALIIGGMLFVLLSKEYGYFAIMIIDLIAVNIAYFIYNKKYNLTVFISIITSVLFVFCIITNMFDNLIKKDDLIKVDKEYSKEIENTDFSVNDSNLYRTAMFADKSKTLNKVYGNDYYSTTIYSSLQNQLYNHFYYDDFQNEMSHRNSATVAETINPFFYSYMGKKYLFVDNGTLKNGTLTIPNGYKEEKKEGNITLFKNDDVMPLGYATSKLMSSSQYESLTYPYNMKALMNYTVVDKDLSNVPVEGIESVDLSDEIFGNLPDNIKYDKASGTVFVNTAEDKKKTKRMFKSSLNRRSFDIEKCVAELKNPINEYLIVTCKADNKIGKKSTDIYLIINGVKNKLTDPSWKYYNNNEKFCFVLSSAEPIKSIELSFSKGKYKLYDWRFYTVKKSELEGLKNNIDEFKTDKSKTKGDVFEGTINVTKDNSYFKMTVPYADGFSAYVDGEKTNIQMVDNAFIGFEISKGRHDIKLVYKAPLLKEAKIVSLIGVLLFVFILAAQIIRKKKFESEISKGNENDEKR